MSLNEFGARMRAMRTSAGLSQTDVERLCGVPKTMLSRYENGHVSPSIETLERLARALGVGPAAFFADGTAPGMTLLAELLRLDIFPRTVDDAIAMAQSLARTR